jgi:glycosyltransferase involved in cell wall biosynthesis
MKLPVVSTNIIGPRESIADGQTGFLVEPINSESLIQPLRTLVLDAPSGGKWVIRQERGPNKCLTRKI